MVGRGVPAEPFRDRITRRVCPPAGSSYRIWRQYNYFQSVYKSAKSPFSTGVDRAAISIEVWQRM